MQTVFLRNFQFTSTSVTEHASVPRVTVNTFVFKSRHSWTGTGGPSANPCKLYISSGGSGGPLQPWTLRPANGTADEVSLHFGRCLKCKWRAFGC